MPCLITNCSIQERELVPNPDISGVGVGRSHSSERGGALCSHCLLGSSRVCRNRLGDFLFDTTLLYFDPL